MKSILLLVTTLFAMSAEAGATRLHCVSIENQSRTAELSVRRIAARGYTRQDFGNSGVFVQTSPAGYKAGMALKSGQVMQYTLNVENGFLVEKQHPRSSSVLFRIDMRVLNSWENPNGTIYNVDTNIRGYKQLSCRVIRPS